MLKPGISSKGVQRVPSIPTPLHAYMAIEEY